MTKILRVALHEYKRHVFNKRFLMGLLSIPLVILVMVGLVFLVISMENNTTPIGYVDYSGLLADPLPAPVPEKPDKPVPMVAYASEEEARAALTAGQIQGYYILPPDYLSTGKVTLVYLEEIKSPARGQFYDFLTVNLLRDIDPQVAERLLEGAEVVITTPDGSRTASNQNWFNLVLPLISGVIFIIAMFSTGGYLMQAVVEEKENRTMEVLITSLSPNQFMAGKIIGDISIGMTQILLWGGVLVLLIFLGRDALNFLEDVRFTPETLAIFALVLLPSFVMVSALMAMIGATVTEAREGQQVVGFIAMPIWIPYMLAFVLIENPNSPISVVLSILPMTATLSILFRTTMTVLPWWQIALSSLVQILGALGAVWLAGRAFRLGMLRYGQRVRLGEIFTRRKVLPGVKS